MARLKKNPDAANGAASPPAPPANVTDETIQEFTEKVLTGRRELKDAQEIVKACNGRLRAVYKAAKSAGINNAALGEYVKLREMDREEVDRNHRDLARIAKVNGTPFQYLLFRGAPVANAVDDERIAQQAVELVTDDSLKAALADGLRLGEIGRGVLSCPYTDPDHPLAIKWMAGWNEGQAKLAEKQFGAGAGVEMEGAKA